MPAPSKLDLIGPDLRRWLAEALEARGFAEIVAVTEELNWKLEAEGKEVTVGKTAVGKFSKALKDQREAFTLAETLLSDLDIEAEGELHKVLIQMIATSAVQFMATVREGDGQIEPKELMALGRMLKDLMASSGMREKLLQGERDRLKAEARAQAAAEVDQALEQAQAEDGLSEDVVSTLRKRFLGLRE